MKYLFFLAMLSVACTCQSQDFFIDGDPYHIDDALLAKHVESAIPKRFRHESPLLLRQYVDENSVYIKKYVERGNVFFNQREIEAYVNEVLQAVMPEEMKGQVNVHAYIERSGEFNASMTGPGIMFVNVGALAVLEDEATLAALLCHELAHYYMAHSLQWYIKWQTDKRFSQDNGFGKGRRRRSEFSISNEKQADSLGLEWLNQSKYALRGFVNLTERMELLEKNFSRVQQREYEYKYRSHPLSEERTVFANEMIQRLHQDSSYQFIVSQEGFAKAQKTARLESLRYFLYDSKNYLKANEMAFRFHIMDAFEVEYIYIMLEAMRRVGMYDPSYWSENFIAFNYQKTVEENFRDGKKKPEYTKSLFDEFDREIMLMSLTDIRNMTERYYWGENRIFNTHEEAFDFYVKVAENMGCTECYLTNALSLKGTEAGAQALDKYLAQPNAKYIEFAQAVKAEKLYKSLPKGKTLFYDDFQCSVRHGEDYAILALDDQNDRKAFKAFINHLDSSLEDRIMADVNIIRKSNLEDYRLLMSLNAYAGNPIMAKGGKIELFYLDPEYWYLFKKLGSREIDFIHWNYYEFQNATREVSDYREIRGITYNEIFGRTRAERSVTLVMTSIVPTDFMPCCFIKWRYNDSLMGRKTTQESMTGYVKSLVYYIDREQEYAPRW